VDFVLVHPRDRVDAIECKWDPAEFDSGSLQVFRSRYPSGRNYLVTPREGPVYAKRFGTLEVLVCDPEGIGEGSPPGAKPSAATGRRHPPGA
jgi:hypothetical protein